MTGKDGNGAVNIFTNDEYIATVRHEYDAYLIAAAPDMYEALKEILIGLHSSRRRIASKLEDAMLSGRLALSKAEGK